MKITRVGAQASLKGPPDWFSGTVRADPLFQAAEPARVQGAHVMFEPAARTAWHTQPARPKLARYVGLQLGTACRHIHLMEILIMGSRRQSVNPDVSTRDRNFRGVSWPTFRAWPLRLLLCSSRCLWREQESFATASPG